MSRITPRQQRLILDAVHDDPGGLDHPIWAELGIEPVAPISAEELELIENAKRTGDWHAVETTKIWGKNPDGKLVKL
jgi:hypothetical protein